MAAPKSIFRSPAGEAAYLAAYHESLARWPLPYEEIDLATSYGTVHAIVSGEPDAPPLLLLHATNAGSTMWYPNIGELGAHFRLIAFDLIGHAGKSLPSRKIRNPGDCAAWILEGLDQLKVDRTAVLGLSVGAWLGLNLALRAPERVIRVAACSPVGTFGPVSYKLLLRMLPLLLFPTRSILNRYMDWVSADGKALPPLLQDQLILGMQHCDFGNPGMYMPNPFTDQQLSHLDVPVLLLLGAQEVMFSTKHTHDRAVAHLRDVEVEVIPRAGHLLTVEQPAQVNRRLLSFLDWQPSDQSRPGD